MPPIDVAKARVRKPVLLELIRDLSSVSQHSDPLPNFDMSVTYERDAVSGEAYGDISAFICRQAMSSARLDDFVEEGGDIVSYAMRHAGLTRHMMSFLVFPEILRREGYPLDRVSGVEAARLVQTFIDTNFEEPDYYDILASMGLGMDFEDGEELSLEETFSPEGLDASVEEFIKRYGST